MVSVNRHNQNGKFVKIWSFPVVLFCGVLMVRLLKMVTLLKGYSVTLFNALYMHFWSLSFLPYVTWIMHDDWIIHEYSFWNSLDVTFHIFVPVRAKYLPQLFFLRHSQYVLCLYDTVTPVMPCRLIYRGSYTKVCTMASQIGIRHFTVMFCQLLFMWWAIYCNLLDVKMLWFHHWKQSTSHAILWWLCRKIESMYFL